MNSGKRRSFGLGRKRRSMNRSQTHRLQSTASIGSVVAGSLLESEDTCIKVVVRSRPLNDNEANKGHEVVGIVDDQLLCFDPPQAQEDFFFQGQKQQLRDLNKRVNKNVQFMFDRVFNGSCSNEVVFSESVQSILDNLLSGFNCSVFAYGATGAGKTFTMLGSKTCPGIIYLIVKDLFNRIEKMADKSCELNVSYLEVYNETVKDLLRPSPALLLRDDSKGVMVAGLSYQKPTSAEHLLELLRFGNRNRTQHPTDANAESSRSHAVFQIFLKVKDRVGGLSENVQLSKMSLIDLAGSERAAVVSNHAKARIREGANINQSLLALGSCINALAAKSGKTQHVPYRNSKLTRILKDSLGGNCRTIMIAAISPSSQSYEDTYNTLKYAERAKGIAVSLKRNVASVDAHFTRYKKVVDNLQKENETLKRQLSELNLQVPKRPRMDTTDAAVQTLQSEFVAEQVQAPKDVLPVNQVVDPDWKRAVDVLCKQIKKATKDVLDCESNMQSIKASRFWRQFSHSRTTTLTGDQNRVTRSLNKLESYMKNNQATSERLGEQRDKNLELLRGKLEMLNHVMASEDTQMGKMYIENQKIELDVLRLKIQLDHAVAVADTNFKQTHESWKICAQALQLVRKQQSMLKGHGFLTADLTTEFEGLLRQAECGREVAWPDQKPVQNPLHEDFLDHLLLPSANCSVLGGEMCGPLAGASSRPLAVFHSRPSDVEFSAAEPPSTPKRESQAVSTTHFVSPPPLLSSIASPLLPSTRVFRSRMDSPYPNVANSSPYRHLNDRGLLEQIPNLYENEEREPVRRSLDDTFVSSTTVGVPSQAVNWEDQMDVHDMSCSQDEFVNQMSELPEYSRSTPCLERPRPLPSLSQFPPRLEFSETLRSEQDYMPTACGNPEFYQQEMQASPFMRPAMVRNNSYVVPSRALPNPARHSPYPMHPPMACNNARANRTYFRNGAERVVSVAPTPRLANPHSGGRTRQSPFKPYHGAQSGHFKSGTFYRNEKREKENVDNQRPGQLRAPKKFNPAFQRPSTVNNNQKGSGFSRHPTNK